MPAVAGEAECRSVPGLVSVIMPAYNAATTIRRSIDSVLAQTRRDLELIIVDDGSTDSTQALVEEYARADTRVRLHRQVTNAGVAAARNAGIERAQGEYVAFLDSDDWWHPRKLELQIEQMQASDARVSYCAYQRIDEDGRLLSSIQPPSVLTHADMLRSNFIGNLTGVYKRSLGPARFLPIGHEDYVFWLQMVRRAGRAIRIEHGEPLAYYLVREGSVSANKLRAAGWQWRIYRDIEGLSLPRAMKFMLHYICNALAKRR
jgi:teichuronic acid biosynthesis glycosyltransferase TuaG